MRCGPSLRRVGSQGIGLDPRKGLEQMEARETGTGEERTARRSGRRRVEEMRTAALPILELKEVEEGVKKQGVGGENDGGADRTWGDAE